MQNRVGSPMVFVEAKGRNALMGFLSPAGDAKEAIRAISSSALSRCRLARSVGSHEHNNGGSRTSGLAALGRKRGRSGAVPGIRRSRTTSRGSIGSWRRRIYESFLDANDFSSRSQYDFNQAGNGTAPERPSPSASTGEPSAGVTSPPSMPGIGDVVQPVVGPRYGTRPSGGEGARRRRHRAQVRGSLASLARNKISSAWEQHRQGRWAACDREEQGIESLLCCTSFRQRRCRRAGAEVSGSCRLHHLHGSGVQKMTAPGPRIPYGEMSFGVSG